MAHLEGSLEQINIRLSNVEAAITDLRRKITANFHWTIGTILFMWVTIMGALAGLFGVIFARLSP